MTEPQAPAHYYRARDRSRRLPSPVSFWHSRKDREKIATHAACAPCKDYQVANCAPNRIDHLEDGATLALLLRRASINGFPDGGDSASGIMSQSRPAFTMSLRTQSASHTHPTSKNRPTISKTPMFVALLGLTLSAHR